MSVLLYQDRVKIRVLDIVGPAGDKTVQLLCVLSARDPSVRDLGQTQFPAGGQTGIQQRFQGAAASVKDHLTCLRRRDDLCFAVEPQIVIVKELFQDFSPSGAGADPAPADLFP